ESMPLDSQSECLPEVPRTASQLAPAGEIPWRTSDAGAGSCLRAAEPFVETDAAEARFAQRHERALLDAAAEVSGLGVTHDRTRVTERLEIAGDDFVERCSFRAGDLNDAVSWRRERHLGGHGSNGLRREKVAARGLEEFQHRLVFK